MSNTVDHNIKPEFDKIIQDIADYVINKNDFSDLAYETAHWCLLDTLGCGILALNYPQCTKLLGPVVEGANLGNGARVPGTDWQLDPVQAAFNIGAMNRWLDFNDTWLAAEWGHPSDNFGGILAVADYLNRNGKTDFTIKDVLTTAIKAYEIQGVLALENSFNRVGLDHVVLVKVASTAVITQMLGGNREQIMNAISLAWVDGQSLRTYRHAPNTGSRKSWAAGDATARAVRLSLIAMTGEMGYPSVLSAKTWGFYDVAFNARSFQVNRAYDSYVMENILFKIAYPAEFHAQTAVECAVQLHQVCIDKFEQIETIKMTTQQSAVRIISKEGPLHNPADRDHCIQYMVAIGLLFGDLTAEHYEDETANDVRIDQLRSKMQVVEDEKFTQDYLDPEKRSIANSLQIFFKDGTQSEQVTIEYPIGHKRRREQGIPQLQSKFSSNLATQFAASQAESIVKLCSDIEKLWQMKTHDFLNEWVK